MNRKNEIITFNNPNLIEQEIKKRISISINVSRYITDVNGAIIADVAVPANSGMRVAYPFHLFGLFDREGGFSIADKILSQQNNTILFGVYVWGNNTPLFFFNPLANINGKIKKGDLVFIYVDNLNAPNYFSFVIMSCADSSAYASILSQTNITQLSKNIWGAFKLGEIQMGWTDDEQLNQPFFQIDSKFDGTFQKDSLLPYEYYNPNIQVQKKINIAYSAIVNQYFGLSSLISFENPLITLQLIVFVL
jgi:hypothetical protein